MRIGLDWIAFTKTPKTVAVEFSTPTKRTNAGPQQGPWTPSENPKMSANISREANESRNGQIIAEAANTILFVVTQRENQEQKKKKGTRVNETKKILASNWWISGHNSKSCFSRDGFSYFSSVNGFEMAWCCNVSTFLCCFLLCNDKHLKMRFPKITKVATESFSK